MATLPPTPPTPPPPLPPGPGEEPARRPRRARPSRAVPVDQGAGAYAPMLYIWNVQCPVGVAPDVTTLLRLIDAHQRAPRIKGFVTIGSFRNEKSANAFAQTLPPEAYPILVRSLAIY